MSSTAFLILENGMVFEGEQFGTHGDITGELVFSTGMTGYLETLTDPSYYGQIIIQTFPLIGNYGIIPTDFESQAVGARAYIVKHPCQDPSNFRSEGKLDTFLSTRGIIGLCGIDTRALTKIIRQNGVMNGKITSYRPAESDRAEAAGYKIGNAVAAVSPHTVVKYPPLPPQWTLGAASRRRRVALMDFGAKRGIADALTARGCEVWSFPHDTSARDIMEAKPDGVMLSNGPGDPADPANSGIVETIRNLQQNGIPIFGICLGHQLLALANGYTTEKLRFGHRGANQPVRDTRTGRVYITSQNHGYAVIAECGSFVNVNDGTCEGLDYGNSFSVQFHPEARGGPLDTAFLFDQFIERMDINRLRSERMELKFTKMHGCGNDYIYFNCFDTDINSPESLSVLLSDRHTGVGGDGIVLMLRSDIADARMRMFNLDGSEGNMCGNAIRCVAKYLYDNGIVRKTQMLIETRSGIREMFLTTTNGVVSSVRVDMGIAKVKKIQLGNVSATYVDVGNPHLVLFRDEIDSIDIAAENYEKDEFFPDGVNTEFVEIIGRNHLKMRVWERGSGETQACGTGACASAAAAVLNGYCDKNADIKVQLLGGELVVNYSDEAVYMTGDCKKVFDGVVEI